MRFKDYLKSENVLYVSDKDYKKVLPLWFIIASLTSVIFIFIFLITKTFESIGYYLFMFLLFAVLNSFWDWKHKLVITKDEILLFGIFGKVISQMPLNQDLFVATNNYCFVIQDKNKKTIKFCLERNQEKIFDILNNNGKVFLFGGENNFTEHKKVDNGFEKFLISFFLLLDIGLFGFLIYNKNEVLSDYYISRGRDYYNREIRENFGIHINSDGENIKQAYYYYKLACSMYPKQQKSVYIFIIAYAKAHNLEEDYKEFSEFYKMVYPE